jgi:hypothetical protein
MREQGFNHRADDRHQTRMNADSLAEGLSVAVILTAPFSDRLAAWQNGFLSVFICVHLWLKTF